MENFFKKHWKKIAIGLAILIMIILIYQYGKNEASIEQVPLPKDDPNSPLTEDQKKRVREISQRLYSDMDSYLVSTGFKPRDTEAYNFMITSSDTLVVAVYNDFNNLYFKDRQGDGTLTKWVTDEYFNPAGEVSNETRGAILKRFAKLNLK